MLPKTFDINSMVSEGAKLLGVGAEEGSAWEIPTNTPIPLTLWLGCRHQPICLLRRCPG